MKSKLEYGLIEGESLIRRTGTALVNNVGKAIAFITIIATALVTFTEVSFYSFDHQHFTTSLFIMLLSSYLMYFSLEDAGEKLGEESDGYKSAVEAYGRLRERIDGASLTGLRDFLQEYSMKELEYRRTNLLVSYGIAPDSYKSYINGEPCMKKERKILKRAAGLRAVMLTARSLLSLEGGRVRSELSDPGRRKLPSMLLKLLPTALCTCVTVSVMLTAKDGLTVGEVIEGILKLLTLPMVGIKGYVAGYRYTLDTEVPWIETKTRILEAFFKKCAEKTA